MTRKSLIAIALLLAAPLPAGSLSGEPAGDLDPEDALERIVDLLSPRGLEKSPGLPAASATARRVEAFRLFTALPEAMQLQVRHLFSPPLPLDCLESELYPIRSCYNFPEEQAKAEAVLSYAEFAWQQEVEVMGFRPPRRGGGSSAEDGLDLYLGDTLSYGAAGYTSPVDLDMSTPITDCTTYIVLNQEEPAGDFLKATTVHEINHSCQMAMDCYETLSSMEATATWTEYRLVPEIDFYFSLTIGDFQQFPNRSVGWRDSYDIYVYGAALFLLFLDRFMGEEDPRFISSLWEGSVQTIPENEPDLLDAIVAAAEARDIPFQELFGEFGEWRYFLGRNDDGEHFENGHEWWGAEVRLDRSFYVSGLDSLPLSYDPSVQPLGYSFALFDLGGSSLPDGSMILTAEGSGDSPFLLQAWFIDGAAMAGRFAAESGDGNALEIVIGSDEIPQADRMVVMLVNMGSDLDWDQRWSSDAFTVSLDHVPRPGILSVTPGTLILGKQEILTVTGEYFSDHAVVTISGEGVDILDAEPAGDGRILVTAAVSRRAQEGERDLTVSNGGPGPGLEATLPGAIRLTMPDPPGIVSLAPDRGLPGESLLVRVDGERLTDEVSVSFSCPEIEVGRVQRASQDALFVSIAIPEDAEPRACAFSAGDDFGRTFTLDDAFRIDAPPAAELEMDTAGGGCGCALAGRGDPAAPALAFLALLFALSLCLQRRA